jgi:hypothetical protein
VHTYKIMVNTTGILQLHHMETDILGSSSSEQGSSWAVEVGGHLKVHSILVENLSKNGQMLVEVCLSMTYKDIALLSALIITAIAYIFFCSNSEFCCRCYARNAAIFLK